MEAYQTSGQHEYACIELGQALWCVAKWPMSDKRSEGHSGWVQVEGQG